MSNFEPRLKKICFKEDIKQHADLCIKLKEDNLTQRHFFRTIVVGYLENDPLIIEFIERAKAKENLQSEEERKKLKRERKKVRQKEEDFLLDDNDIQNIFDVIERENSDL